MSAAELDVTPDAEIVDPTTQPAIILGCKRCREPALLRPGGLCADCVAVIGLADDQTEYQAWRDRVSDDIAVRPVSR